MGCSHDMVRVGLKSKEHAEIFAKLFFEEIKDELYGLPWCSKPEHFAIDSEPCAGMYWMSLDGEPIYSRPDMCQNGIDAIKKFLSMYPDADLIADLEESFNNCGDTHMTHLSWSAEKKVLCIDYRSAESPYLDYCEECEYDAWEAYEEACEEDEDAEKELDEEDFIIARLETHELGQTYTCPKCGAELEFDVYIVNQEIPFDELLKKD